MPHSSNTQSHYGSTALLARLQTAITQMDLPNGPLPPEALAPVDQFHAGGLIATAELADLIEIKKGEKLLDIGSGLGGPARFLASTYGCTVKGIDLSPTFVEAATYLSQLSEFGGEVSYECGDALCLPYESETFDIVWTQHTSMNIANKAALFTEAHRVLKDQGKFAIFDVVEGTETPIHFPVPWARIPEDSYLIPPNSLRAYLEAAGFRVLSWRDYTPNGIKWFEERQIAEKSAEVPILGLHLVMGTEFSEMARNFVRNLREGRAKLIQVVLDKPSSSTLK